MSDPNKKTNDLRWVIYLFSIWTIFSLLIIVRSIIIGRYTLTEYLVEYGDSFSALLTAITILLLFLQMSQSDKDRQQTLEELEKDRKLTIQVQQKEMKLARIKEQLEFYSPLVGRCLRFDYDSTPPTEWLNEVTQQCNTLALYQLYAEPETKEILRQYFSGEHRGSDKWYEFRESIRQAILRDYNMLTMEYNKLL